ncbi:hypothetical protein BDD12DRAFT_264372 [Trichophaea hybrida]|nr:hypothetical protein BDD12DRAFT_264372 [Trichophaea hybrida]
MFPVACLQMLLIATDSRLPPRNVFYSLVALHDQDHIQGIPFQSSSSLTCSHHTTEWKNTILPTYTYCSSLKLMIDDRCMCNKQASWLARKHHMQMELHFHSIRSIRLHSTLVFCNCTSLGVRASANLNVTMTSSTSTLSTQKRRKMLLRVGLLGLSRPSSD